MARTNSPEHFVVRVESFSATASLNPWDLSRSRLKFQLEYGRTPEAEDPVYDESYGLEGKARVVHSSLSWLEGRTLAWNVLHEAELDHLKLRDYGSTERVRIGDVQLPEYKPPQKLWGHATGITRSGKTPSSLYLFVSAEYLRKLLQLAAFSLNHLFFEISIERQSRSRTWNIGSFNATSSSAPDEFMKDYIDC